MELFVEHVDVWAATVPDKPGGLAEVLATLRDVGANLESIISRRAPEQPGKGVVFVTPLRSDREIAAASDVGFNVTQTLHSVRVMGADRPGIAADLTQKLADRGINLRGFSASVIGTQFIAYVATDSLEDANQALEIRLVSRICGRAVAPAACQVHDTSAISVMRKVRKP
ncbi:MAG: ACT domain-containing protein [Comamonadaceae bacterium]|nr:ACT domain-containing protein [Comamonadaceae bacterium]